MSAPTVDLSDVRVDVCVELGRKRITFAEARRVKEGDVIELEKLAGEAMDVLVNGRRLAEGEIVVAADLMTVRLTRMVAPEASP
jgi:flagellar motor switch protein FliN/FliY